MCKFSYSYPAFGRGALPRVPKGTFAKKPARPRTANPPVDPLETHPCGAREKLAPLRDLWMERALVSRECFGRRFVLSRDGNILAAYLALDIDPRGHIRVISVTG